MATQHQENSHENQTAQDSFVPSAIPACNPLRLQADSFVPTSGIANAAAAQDARGHDVQTDAAAAQDVGSAAGPGAQPVSGLVSTAMGHRLISSPCGPPAEHHVQPAAGRMANSVGESDSESPQEHGQHSWIQTNSETQRSDDPSLAGTLY